MQKMVLLRYDNNQIYAMHYFDILAPIDQEKSFSLSHPKKERFI